MKSDLLDLWIVTDYRKHLEQDWTELPPPNSSEARIICYGDFLNSKAWREVKDKISKTERKKIKELEKILRKHFFEFKGGNHKAYVRTRRAVEWYNTKRDCELQWVVLYFLDNFSQILEQPDSGELLDITLQTIRQKPSFIKPSFIRENDIKINNIFKNSETLDEYVLSVKSFMENNRCNLDDYRVLIWKIPKYFSEKFSTEIFSEFIIFLNYRLNKDIESHSILLLASILRSLVLFQEELGVKELSNSIFDRINNVTHEEVRCIRIESINELMTLYALFWKILEIPYWILQKNSRLTPSPQGKITFFEKKLLDEIRRVFPWAKSWEYLCWFETDIYIPELKLNIEWDGREHRLIPRSLKDALRDKALLEDFEITTLRFISDSKWRRDEEDYKKDIQHLLNWIQTLCCHTIDKRVYWEMVFPEKTNNSSH